MARQLDKGHKEKHKHKDRHEAKVEAHPAHQDPFKSSKPSKSHKSFSNAAKFPKKEPAGVKKPSQSKNSVNIAGVFKKSKHDDKKHRKRKKRTPTPEPDLADELRDGIEEARAAIDKKLSTSFDAVHADFVRTLSESRIRDRTFVEAMVTTANILVTPLVEEEVETTFQRDGKHVVEVVHIGKRVEQFKKSIEKDEAKLKGYWKQWEGLQGEFLELGMEIFGPEAFAEPAEEGDKTKGYKKEMELLGIEHSAKVQELNEEVEDIAERTLARMKESEKHLDVSARAQQAKLLQALIAD